VVGRRILPALLAVLLGHAAAAAELGRDLLGQQCRDETATATSADPRLPPPVDIYCGAGGKPVGRLHVDWVGEAPPNRDTIIAASRPAAEVALRLACSPGQWSGDVLVAACTAREGGWPALTLAAWRGPLLLLAEGVPANRPALVAAMNRMAPPPPGSVAETPAAGDLVDPALVAAYRDLTQQARLANAAGNHGGAEQAYRKALDLQRKVFGEADAALGDTLMHLALEVSNQGRFVEAAELFRRAEPLVQKSVVPLDLPRLTSYQALDAANRHSYAEARELARQANRARQGMLAQDVGHYVRGEQVHGLLIEAAMSLKLDDVATASVAAAEALAVTDETPGLPGGWKIQALTVLGEALGRQGRGREGESLLKEAVAASQRLFGDGMPSIMTLAALGRFYADQGRYAEAMESFRQEFVLLARRSPEGLRLSFEAVEPFFATALELAEQGGPERERILDRVFSVLQLVQAGTQSDTVTHAALKFASSDPRIAALVAERQDSQRRRDEARLSVASAAARPDDQRDSEREAWLADEYRRTAARMAELDATLKTEFPDYAGLASPLPVTVARLRAVLQPGEAVVAFAFGDKSGLGMAVTAGDIQAARLPLGEATLAAAVGELRQGIQVQGGRVGHYDLVLAHRLYRELVAPLGVAAARSLLVVPAGALSSLPLAALVASPPKGAQPQGADWLVHHSAVNQWPSVGALVTMRRHARRSAAPLPFLGIGNPRFTGGGKGLDEHCRDDGPLPAGLLSQLAPLPDTATELHTVAASLGAGRDDLLLDISASESALRAKSLDRYRVLYFATHGLLPAELRCQSEPGLALTPPAIASTKAEDGLLEASEIAGLNLDADLVVLSACNTASAGGRFGGEALSSLADVFFHAGARSVLATHWPVPSASTSRMMIGMFRNGGDYPQALQRAQLDMLSDAATAHPVHWAGFALIGGTAETRP
jgi:CHAT domain-containing protein